MKKFIAYFDFLGFKDFIENNSLEEQKEVMGFIYRDIELALSNWKTTTGKYSRIADISESKINCINFSDTVVFWTNDDTLESFENLLETSYHFNWQANRFTFPVRGAIVFGEIHHSDFRSKSSFKGKYNVNSVFGKGLVEAYLKAESQHWAGAVVDESVIEKLKHLTPNWPDKLATFATEYMVPYKSSPVHPLEFVLRFGKGSINTESYENLAKNIRENFEKHKKTVAHLCFKEKLENTLKFLSTF